jgi:hypothetical protein
MWVKMREGVPAAHGISTIRPDARDLGIETIYSRALMNMQLPQPSQAIEQ